MAEKKEQTERKEKHRCIKCNSSFGYLRIKDKVWICRSCGTEDKEAQI
jgi:ribosomal protein L37AE/L43A